MHPKPVCAHVREPPCSVINLQPLKDTLPTETPTLLPKAEISHFEANFPKSPALPFEFDFLPLKLCWIKNE